MQLVELDDRSAKYVANLVEWDCDYEITKIDKIVNDKLDYNHKKLWVQNK